MIRATRERGAASASYRPGRNGRAVTASTATMDITTSTAMRFIVAGARLFQVQECRDAIVEEPQVCRIAGGAGGMPPQRWNRREGHAGNERLFVARVGHRKVQIGFRRHV